MPIRGIDRRTVTVVAERANLPRGPTEKALHLVALLEEISRDTYLKNRLVLKGGTALNLFYGKMARLSIDADFDYIGAIEKKRMQKERPRVIARLEEAGQALGFEFEQDLDAYAGAILHFRYTSVFGSRDLVKADVNFLNRLPVLGRVEWRSSTLGTGAEPVNVPCLSADELAGFKLGTLCVRAAPRDLFDVARLTRLAVNKETVRKVALFRGFLEALDLGLFNPGLADSIEQVDLDNKVSPMLERGEFASKASLMKEASPWLHGLLSLGKEEEAFRQGLLDGEVDTRLLFGKIRVHDRLSEHPALMRRLEVKKAEDFQQS